MKRLLFWSNGVCVCVSSGDGRVPGFVNANSVNILTREHTHSVTYINKHTVPKDSL